MSIEKANQEMLEKVKEYIDLQSSKYPSILNEDGNLLVEGSETGNVKIDLSESHLKEIEGKLDKETFFKLINGETISQEFTFDFANKIKESSVENPNFSGIRNTKNLELPTSNWYEINQNSYDEIAFYDDKNFKNSISEVEAIAQNNFKIKLLDSLNKIVPNFFVLFGVNTTEEKIKLLKNMIQDYTIEAFARGSGANGNEVSLRGWNGSNWSNLAKHTSSEIEKLSYSAGNNFSWIQEDGTIDLLVYSTAASADIESAVDINYLCVKVTISYNLLDIINSNLQGDIAYPSITSKEEYLTISGSETANITIDIEKELINTIYGAQLDMITTSDGSALKQVSSGQLLTEALKVKGLKTYIVTNGSSDYPETAGASMRGFTFMASSSYGIALFIDIDNNTYSRSIVNSQWVGEWQKLSLSNELEEKQEKLIAGENITIAADGRTISAVSGSSGGAGDYVMFAGGTTTASEAENILDCVSVVSNGNTDLVTVNSNNTLTINEAGTYYITVTAQQANREELTDQITPTIQFENSESPFWAGSIVSNGTTPIFLDVITSLEKGAIVKPFVSLQTKQGTFETGQIKLIKLA